MSTPLSEKTLPPLALSEPVQCPRCRTRYDLGVADLEAADGWVRCGACEQVFFAPACLSRDLTPLGWTGSDQPRTAAQHPGARASSSGSGHSQASERMEPTLRTTSAQQATPVGQAMPSTPRDAGNKTPSALLYALMVGLAVVMLLSLATLELYRSRHVMAAMWPELKPALLGFCQPFSCTLETPRDLQALSIESSALDPEPERPRHFALSIKLRNHNSYPVAAPMVKLVLLNEQEEVVLQEEFDLAQISNTSAIEPGVITPWRVPVVVKESIADKLATGYRVELLYKP